MSNALEVKVSELAAINRGLVDVVTTLVTESRQFKDLSEAAAAVAVAASQTAPAVLQAALEVEANTLVVNRAMPTVATAIASAADASRDAGLSLSDKEATELAASGVAAQVLVLQTEIEQVLDIINGEQP